VYQCIDKPLSGNLWRRVAGVHSVWASSVFLAGVVGPSIFNQARPRKAKGMGKDTNRSLKKTLVFTFYFYDL
jgi:hypothetical protein